jgi:mannose-6-phosphate isomerase class I
LFLEVGPLAPGGGIETISLHPGEAYYLSAQTIHRFCAGDQRVKLLEVSNAGPSDSVRLEDDYRRITKIPIVGPHSEK